MARAAPASSHRGMAWIFFVRLRSFLLFLTQIMIFALSWPSNDSAWDVQTLKSSLAVISGLILTRHSPGGGFWGTISIFFLGSQHFSLFLVQMGCFCTLTAFQWARLGCTDHQVHVIGHTQSTDGYCFLWWWFLGHVQIFSLVYGVFSCFGGDFCLNVAIFLDLMQWLGSDWVVLHAIRCLPMDEVGPRRCPHTWKLVFAKSHKNAYIGPISQIEHYQSSTMTLTCDDPTLEVVIDHTMALANAPNSSCCVRELLLTFVTIFQQGKLLICGTMRQIWAQTMTIWMLACISLP